MALLGVNIDHIASVRQLRKARRPEPAHAAALCERAGADSIVAHLREDRRHINEEDVRQIQKAVRIPFNLEMSVADDIVAFALKAKPFQATLVPEKRRELTTEGGLDIVRAQSRVSRVCAALKKKDIHVSLFIDPDIRQIKAAVAAGAGRVELHTGRYAESRNRAQRKKCLAEIRDAVSYARACGLRVFAGHGLDYGNVRDIARIRQIEELNIGYSIVCRALFVGIEQAVRQMKELVR